MRIARRPSTPFAVPSGAAIPIVAALVLATAVTATFAARQSSGSTAPIDSAHSPITMADAFGLGGLSVLSDGAPSHAPSPVESNQIVSYYGNPYTPSMGILGQHRPEDVANLLDQAAGRFRYVSGARVLPALHVVYAVAQPQPGSDASSLQYLDDRSVRQYIDLARRHGFVVILDLQIGHSDALAEVERIAKYLREPDVFVALDPEFALSSDRKPGEAIGSIDASAINDVQAYLVWLTAQQRIPKKLLVVHQFEAGMLTRPELIERRDDVDLLVDMDGYGPADIKEVKYGRYAAAPYAPFGGIKIFLQHDPDPLSELQIESLQPRPSLIVYQ